MNAQPTWIWYPGDFEIWLGNRFNNRRTERGAMMPPFWKQDSHWPTVVFTKTVMLQASTRVEIAAEGKYVVSIDGQTQFGIPSSILLPAGEHHLCIKVHNPASPPALYVSGDEVCSDNTWQVTYEDKIWIDECGTPHGCGVYVSAGCWNFTDPDNGPSTYALARRPERPSTMSEEGRGLLVDFGKETMGYLTLEGLTGEGMLNIFYGESSQEALNRAYCETLDQLEVCKEGVLDLATNTFHDRASDFTLAESKAFRHVYIEGTGNVRLDGVSMQYEYAPLTAERNGWFKSSDEELNHIWETAAYTLDLTTREFFTDGIKRDRWTWSGDAIQSYLMNYYLRNDTECVKRTIRQLRGKDPVTSHINTIMDYTFYWFKSILDYHLYTGDLDFVREMWPRMTTLMDYCLKRTNSEGMMPGQADDWIFIDWVDFPMHKRGVVCFEQLLFCKALETMHTCASLLGLDSPYGEMATRLLAKVKKTFWSEERHAFLHALEDGKLNEMVTKFPNMFAILYDFADDSEREAILHHVLLNDKVEAITTPYMRFYELEALCMAGQQSTVLKEIKSYWGGMLREGATTFWEKYNPEEHGAEHFAMYGRPYGKSLCHSWGASPIYLLGRYFLGVKPTGPGYSKYEVRPALGGVEWMEGEIPTPYGPIHIRVTPGEVTIETSNGNGELFVAGHRLDILPNRVFSVILPPSAHL